MTKPAKILELVRALDPERIRSRDAALRTIEDIFDNLDERGQALLVYLSQTLMASREYQRREP